MGVVSPEQAICMLADAFTALRQSGVVRSKRLVGDIGEWFVSTLYDVGLPLSQTQKGWDLLEQSTGQRLQVKTQTFDKTNQWNYLTTEPALFDRLLVVLLNDTFLMRDLYDIPTIELQRVIRVGKEKKPIYYFKDLTPWRVDISRLSGYTNLGKMSQGYL